MAKTEKPKAKKSTTKEKQKKVAKEIMENHGISVSAAMRKAGYSKNYAKNPQEFVATKSWQELMEEYLPDDLLSQRHRELLDKREVIILRSGKDVEYELSDQPETQAVKAGLDMAYKLKGKYSPELSEHIIRNYEDLSDEELERLYHAKANKRTKK